MSVATTQRRTPDYVVDRRNAGDNYAGCRRAESIDKKRIFWEEPKKDVVKATVLKYDGVPFTFRSLKTLNCQFGRDKNSKNRKKEGPIKIGAKQKSPKKSLLKRNCPACIYIREICRYPGFKLKDDSSKCRHLISRKLKTLLCDPNSSVLTETRFYVKLPIMDQHTGHEVGDETAMRLPVDPRVKRFIQYHIGNGIGTVSELQQLTDDFVQNQLFQGQPLPSRCNRRFYPTKRDFSNLLYRARKALECTQTNHVDHRNDEEDNVIIDGFSDVPEVVNSLLGPTEDTADTLAVECRRHLRQMIDATFLFTDVERFRELQVGLQFLYNRFISELPQPGPDATSPVQQTDGSEPLPQQWTVVII